MEMTYSLWHKQIRMEAETRQLKATDSRVNIGTNMTLKHGVNWNCTSLTQAEKAEYVFI